MKKIFSKKYLTTLISSLVIGTGIVLACGGDWGDETSSSNFTPEAFADSAYRPFFYSGWNFYYAIGHDMQHDTRFNQSNMTDWSSYLGNAVSDEAELVALLQNTSSGSIDSAAAFLTGKQKTLPLSTHSLQLLKKGNKKVTAFITYLSFAKKCEVFAVNNLEYEWDYETKKNKTSNINTNQLNKELLQEFTKTKDPFIKERYWFQLERSYFFNEPPQSAIDLFENNEKAFPKNDMYYRTMAYAAGAYHKLKNYSKANYYYSKVYDGCAILKTVAHFSFHPQEENDWKATLSLCANNDEKATLWQMLGIFYSDEKRAIQEIYSLNPRSEKLDLLLTRAINIEEQRFSGGEGSSFTIKKDTINSELYALVTRIAQDGITSQPCMWYMAAGYLDMMSGNLEKATASYKLAEKKLPKEELVQSQLRLLKLINTIAGVSNADSKLEKTILADLEWLVNNLAPHDLRSMAALNWIKKTLSNRYSEQKEFIKAVCFSNYDAFYGDNNNIEAMKRFLSKPDKTPYESIYVKMYPLTVNDLLEFQAINLTFDDKLGEAITKLEAIPASETMPGNPFNGRLQDCHDCDHEAAQKIKYTKLSLLKKMKDMEDKIKAGTEVYTNAMLVANAFYNITYYGNARAFYECKVVGDYYYSPFDIGSELRSLPTGMEHATKYYTLALNTAKTDEQKAKCHFMLAKCERNKYYNENIYNNKNYQYGGRSNLADFLAWDGFVSLKQYANTQFYKEAIKECGYFRTYTQK
jgi:hypothetical protein